MTARERAAAVRSVRRTGVRLSTSLGGFLVVFLLAVASAHATTKSLTWQNKECWQTGQLGAESFACEKATTPGYLATHTIENVNTVENLKLTQSGQYCSYGGLRTLGQKEEHSWFEVPAPAGSYQQGNGQEDVCAVWAPTGETAAWGLQLNDNPKGVQKRPMGECDYQIPNQRCKIEHYYSSAGQGLNDRPWANFFSNPYLQLEDLYQYQVNSLQGFEPGGKGIGWGYLCPVLEDSTTGDIIEYCFQEWFDRGVNNKEYGEWGPNERSPYEVGNNYYHVAQCRGASGSFEHSHDKVITRSNGSEFQSTYLMWNVLAKEPVAESAFPTSTIFAASIDLSEMIYVAELIDKPYSAKTEPGGYKEEPELGKGCGRAASTSPANWALIGVENGVEEWEAEEGSKPETGLIRAVEEPPVVKTVFIPHVIEIPSESATKVTETEATIGGEIDPYGIPTAYVVEYGIESVGEHTTAEAQIGSGVSPVPVSTKLTGLHSSSTYKYRIKTFHYGKGNEPEAVYGTEGSFTTLSPVPLAQCAGANIEAAGSSLQAEAQGVWNVTFNAPTLVPAPKTSCNGEYGSKGKPTVRYSATSSGRGFAAWNEGTNFGKLAFIGTDNPPNAGEKAELESKNILQKGNQVLTVPVLQGAVAVIVNLPEGCLAESTSAKHRLALDQTTLEGIFAGTITEWGQIKDDGDKIVQNTASGSPTCHLNTAIKTAVREDGSGTTHIFKRFLHWSDEGSLATPSGSFTWDELSEGARGTLWPTGVGALRGSGSEGMVEAVENNPGSVGYANLADARDPAFSKFIPPTGGESKQLFWAVVENTNISGVSTYADPSANKDVATRTSANCQATEYANGVNSFPPPSVESAWNEVMAKQYSKTYAICGLTYDLVLANYGAFVGATQGEATTVRDYETYLLDKHGGQDEIAKHDYAALPLAPLNRATEGLSLIVWLP